MRARRPMPPYFCFPSFCTCANPHPHARTQFRVHEKDVLTSCILKQKMRARNLLSTCVRAAAPFVPVVVLIFAGILGTILAELEGWPDLQGFYYIISMLCGLPNPITDDPGLSPTSTEGKFIDIVVALWSWALIGTVIGVVGGLTVVTQLVESAEGLGQRVATWGRRTLGFKSKNQVTVVAPTDEETGEEVHSVESPGAGGKKNRHPHHRGGGDDNVAATVESMSSRIAALESVISKQSAMLETLLAAYEK